MHTSKPPRPGQGATLSHTIQFRPDVGVRVWTGETVERVVPQPEHLQGTVRGTVKGFSRKAANRLRNLLFPLDYENAFGIALTAPPWATVRPEQAFDAVSKHKARCRGLRSLVWRKEVTARGVPHYHVIVFLSEPDFRTFQRVQNWLVTSWANALVPRLCPCRVGLACTSRMMPANTEAGRDWIRRVNLGADNLTLITSGNAVQYLCDHTSKHKAYQAKTRGRTWGVWFSERLPVLRVPGWDLDRLPARIVRRIQKALGKMSRYWFKDSAAPFGYRWSHERRFTGPGSRVLFKPAAASSLSRLIGFHLAESAATLA